MRRWLFASVAVLLLFSVTACSLPFSFDSLIDEEESDAEERTYVITTESHFGLEMMTDYIQWNENSVCAVEYLGSADSYTQKLAKLYRSRFSDIDKDVFDAMRHVDVGGKEVYLVVPRFDLEVLSVFAIGFDAEKNPHILRQVTDTDEPFLLFCNPGGTSNTQISAALRSVQQRFKYIPSRFGGTGTMENLTVGYQPIEQ